MDATQTNEYRVPILTYHSIDNSGSVVSTNPDTFRRQMQHLRESSFNVISLEEIATCIHQRRPIPSGSIAITFDDGYQNLYTEALPVLQQYGFRATVFLITDYCGKHNNWAGNSPLLERRPLLSWSEIEEMRKYGFEFGAHTLTHPDLTRLPLNQAEREVRQSKIVIEERLGVEIGMFAYPYGRHDEMTEKIVQQYFHGACSTILGKVERRRSNPFLLERIDSYYLSNHHLFTRLSTSTLDWYLQLRQLLRGIKNKF